MKALISIDLSTTATGWSTFDIKNKKLLEYGIIKPENIKGITKMKYPRKPLEKMRSIASQLDILIRKLDPEIILIEEVCRGKSRLGQKVLNGCHFIVLRDLLKDAWTNEIDYLARVRYIEVIDWRRILNIRLSPQDKVYNSEARKLNKRLTSKQGKVIITAKHLACRFANAQFGLELDIEKRKTDSDLADSICIGCAFLTNIGG